jgi:hypothetical protein
MYTSVFNRTYGSQIYDGALKIQTALLENFLFHHFEPDIRFHQKLRAQDINLTDPIARIRMRERNREDKLIKQKYFSDQFNIKTFVNVLLENFFRNVTWRYIGGGQEMHRRTLTIILRLFELGLMEVDEMPEFTALLLQKLENLLVLETATYRDFDSSLANLHSFREMLKAYFYECKELVVSICIQIVVLLNDEAFKDSFNLFRGKKHDKRKSTKNDDTRWEKSYFNNSRISNVLNRILTSYILQFRATPKVEERKNLFTLINSFLMLVMDMRNDVYYNSARIMTQPLIDYYFSGPHPSLKEEAVAYKNMFVMLIDEFAHIKTQEEVTINRMSAALKRLLVSLKQKSAEELQTYLFVLAEECVPTVLMAMNTLIVGKNLKKELQSLCMLAITEISKNNASCQAVLMNSDCMTHWLFLLSKSKILALNLLTKIFEFDCRLVFVDTEIFPTFMTQLKELMWKHFSTTKASPAPTTPAAAEEKPPEPKNFDTWFKEFKDKVLTNKEDSESSFENLLIVFLFLRMMNNFVRKRDTVYEERFFSLIIQKLIAQCFIDIFIKILLDQDFLPMQEEGFHIDGQEEAKTLDGVQTKKESISKEDTQKRNQESVPTLDEKRPYKFKPQLSQDTSYEDLINLIERKKSGDLRETDLRGLLFEVAMYTMVLMVESCSSVYHYWVHNYLRTNILPSYLEKTEYLMKIPVFGLRYRSVALQLYSCFAVFPGNGILGCRDELLSITTPSRIEVRVTSNHSKGEIVDSFIKELLFTDRVQNFLDKNEGPDTLDIARKLYLRGIFPMVYKYLKGMYVCYTVDNMADGLFAKLKELMEAIRKVKPFLKSIGISPAESPFVRAPRQNNTVSKKNKILPVASHQLAENTGSNIGNLLSMHSSTSGGVNYSKFDRPYDQTELNRKTLGEIRDLLEDLMNETVYLYHHCPNQDDQQYFINLESRLVHPSSITATKVDPEPWKNSISINENLSQTQSGNSLAETKKSHIMSVTRDLVERTGLTSTQFRSFIELMESYQNSKVKELSKPPSENNLIVFLSSSSSNNDNLIAFFGVLTERMFADLFKEGFSTDRNAFIPVDPSKPDASNLYPLAKRLYFNCSTRSLESKMNIDHCLVTFLENDIFNSIVRFLSNMMSTCQPIRRELFESASRIITEKNKIQNEMSEAEKNEGKLFEHNWTYNFLSLIMFIHSNLVSLTMNKTFHDHEYEIIRDREIELSNFLKNLCERNYLPFKEYLGEMVPRIAGLPQYNLSNFTALKLIYTTIDKFLSQSKVHINKYPVLVNEDSFDTFTVINRLLSIVSETCTGPCSRNQKSVYKMRSDNFIGILRRMIDDVESSIYLAKTSVIEYLISLMDGGNDEIIVFFGSSITFEELFSLIIDHCKRLFIYIKFKKDKKSFLDIASAARKHRSQQEKEKEDHSEKLTQDKMNDRDKFDYFSYLRMLKAEDINNAVENNSKLGSEQNTKVDIIVDRQAYLQSSLLKVRVNEGLDEFYNNFGSRFVSKEILDYYKIEDFADIMDQYIANPDFSNHRILQIILKLNGFLIRFSNKISGFNICLQNVYRSLIDHFGELVPRHIHKELGYYQRSEVDTQPSEKLMIYMFITKIISQVEIINPASISVQNFQFQLVPKTFFLTAKTKDQFMRTADTEGMTIEMMQNFDQFNTEMTYNLNFHQKYPWIYKLTSDDAFNTFKIILWLLGLTLNILLILFFRRNYYEKFIQSGGNIAIIVIAILICALSFFGSIGWFMSRYQQKVKLNRTQIEEEEKKSGRRDKFKFLKVYVWRSIVEESYMIIFMIHLLSNILGLLFDPFFYTIQLMMIVFISTTANYVVKAITTHFKQLSLTMFLAILVMHSYSVLTAGHFWDYIDGNQPGQSGPLRCSYLWECLLFTVNQGLRNGGGISDSTMSLDSNDSESKYISKFFYDLIFFMFINVISLNIIFGIIIDTFAAMREAKDERGTLRCNPRHST